MRWIFFAIVVPLLCNSSESFSTISNLHKKRGQARKVPMVHWYHFPKSGGTTLRQVLHDVCVSEGFNMTTRYGLPNEHASLTNCCVKGSGVHFIYGHAIPPMNLDDENILRVIMLRDPLSWLVSRFQYNSKIVSSTSVRTLPDAAIQWGGIYFKYFDKKTADALNAWFDHQKLQIKGQTAGPVLAIAQTALSRIDNVFEHSMIALINEYFEESLDHLNFLYDTKHFTSSLRENRNSASHTDLATSIATAQEVKYAMQLLQPHYAVYNAAMRYFMERVRTKRS